VAAQHDHGPHGRRPVSGERRLQSQVEQHEIVEIVGWTEDSVDKIIRRHVGRHAAVKARIARINETKKRTEIAE